MTSRIILAPSYYQHGIPGGQTFIQSHFVQRIRQRSPCRHCSLTKGRCLKSGTLAYTERALALVPYFMGMACTISIIGLRSRKTIAARRTRSIILMLSPSTASCTDIYTLHYKYLA